MWVGLWLHIVQGSPFLHPTPPSTHFTQAGDSYVFVGPIPFCGVVYPFIIGASPWSSAFQTTVKSHSGWNQFRAVVFNLGYPLESPREFLKPWLQGYNPRPINSESQRMGSAMYTFIAPKWPECTGKTENHHHGQQVAIKQNGIQYNTVLQQWSPELCVLLQSLLLGACVCMYHVPI